MADNTKIEWADATVNAINGCSVTSPGCTHCYAMKLAGTRMKTHPTREGLTIETKAGPVWNGEVRLHEPALLQPLSWSKPRRIFWNAHGDTFHESVPDEWIDRIFAVAALTPQHTHMILTKRSKRMREYVTGGGLVNRKMAVWRAMYGLAKTRAAADVLDSCYGGPTAAQWPLVNVWLGVSVEDQTRADERREDFRNTPAAVKFVSYEPALGYVNWSGWGFIDQIIAGGESGPHARPPHPQWFRDTRDWCAAESIHFFFKQWGEWRDRGGHVPIPSRNHQSHICYLDKDSGRCKPHPNRFSDETMIRMGKGKSGRLLDGIEHNGRPDGVGR